MEAVDSAVVSSRAELSRLLDGHEYPRTRPSSVTDAVVVGVARRRFGAGFTPEQKAEVEQILRAADSDGFVVTWLDPLYNGTPA